MLSKRSVSGNTLNEMATSSPRSAESVASPQSQCSYPSPTDSSAASSSHISDFDLNSMSRSNSITDRMSSHQLDKRIIIAYKYQLTLTGVLGAGSAGQVYRAQYKPKFFNNHEIEVAVKTLKNIDPNNVNQVDNFLQEAKYTQQLQSNHAIKLIGICAKPPDPICLVLPVMACSLYDFLQSTKPSDISWKQRLIIASNIIDGLRDLFRQNVIQRDLKSSNILLSNPDAEGIRHALLADFDLIIIKPEGSHAVKTEFLCGTVPWMAPELLEKEFKRPDNDPINIQNNDISEELFEYNSKIIIYTFSWLLWSLVSHKTPFEFQELHSRNLGMLNTIIHAIINGTRAEIPQLNAPAQYNDLIIHGWDPEPGFRPTLNEASRILHKLLK